MNILRSIRRKANRFEPKETVEEDENFQSEEDETSDLNSTFISEAIEEYLSSTNNFHVTPEILQSASDKIMEIENAIGEIIAQLEDMDPSESPIYEISVKELQIQLERNGTNLNFWTPYLSEVFRDSPELQLDLNKDFFQTSRVGVVYVAMIFKNVFNKQSPEAVELYIWYTLLKDFWPYTTNRMRMMYEDISDPDPKYCTKVVKEMMGIALSFGIAEPDFLTKTKGKLQTMLEHIKTAFSQSILSMDWVDVQTKKEILDKVKKVTNQIGLPDWITNKTTLENHYKEVSYFNSNAYDIFFTFYHMCSRVLTGEPCYTCDVRFLKTLKSIGCYL